MKCYTSLMGAIGLLCVVGTASASITEVTLGDQDFIDGTVIGSANEFNIASLGEPAPFHRTIGSDLSVSSVFNGDWTFNFAPSIFTEASITLGILDHDSAAPGDQVGSFLLDGIDLTPLLNAQFESRGGAQIEYNVYTINLPITALGSLSDGSATFSLRLKPPGLRSGETTTRGNGAGLDFSTLAITTRSVLDIGIDILPGGDPGPVNALSQGVLPVALLGSGELDVVEVDIASLLLEGAAAQTDGQGDFVSMLRDVNQDGYEDLVLHFLMDGFEIAPDAVEAGLMGSLLDGTQIQGRDTIRQVGPHATSATSGSAIAVVIPEPTTAMIGTIFSCGLLLSRRRSSGA